jgi:hypothetical protein
VSDRRKRLRKVSLTASAFSIMERPMHTFIKNPRNYALLLAATLAVGSASVMGEDSKLTLTGSEEAPPVKTSASGVGTIKVAESKAISGTIKTVGIFGSVAHIHVGAPGQSGPPIITLRKVAEDMWSVPPGSTLTDEQYTSYTAGNLYVNIQSPWHKEGEIRAQHKP